MLDAVMLYGGIQANRRLYSCHADAETTASLRVQGTVPRDAHLRDARSPNSDQPDAVRRRRR